MELYDWQKTAIQNWNSNDNNGTIVAATGSGKTRVAVEAINLKHKTKTLIVVPTVQLLHQWGKELADLGKSITKVGGGNRNYMGELVIAIVNSIRFEDLSQFDLCVIDECHHTAMSAINKLFHTRHDFINVLALSATVERADKAHGDFLLKYPIIYELTSKDAIEKKYLSEFSLINIECKLTEAEKINYEIYHKKIIDYSNKNRFSGGFGSLPYQIKGAISNRKKIILNAKDKYEKLRHMIFRELKTDDKVIVFSELVKSAEEIRKVFEENNIKAAIYHSGMKKVEKENNLGWFENDAQVLVTVKALDEGLNIVSANVGIIFAGSSVDRQTIQRLGRILRKKNDNRDVRFYQLFVGNTVEKKWVDARNRILIDSAKKIEWKKW